MKWIISLLGPKTMLRVSLLGPKILLEDSLTVVKVINHLGWKTIQTLRLNLPGPARMKELPTNLPGWKTRSKSLSLPDKHKIIRSLGLKTIAILQDLRGSNLLLGWGIELWRMRTPKSTIATGKCSKVLRLRKRSSSSKKRFVSRRNKKKKDAESRKRKKKRKSRRRT